MITGDENLILYLNLTGELFYIVAHRMRSQKVKIELAKKVFNDLGLAICSPSRLHALLCGDISLVNMKFDQVRGMLDQIAHCSIMTVNQYSLEKLFELVMIATKYQFTMCQHPNDMLLITLNHLDNLRRVLTDIHAVRLAEDLHNVLVITYGRANVATMKNYLDAIRNYVQEVRLKMTNLIKLGLQTANGEFATDYPPDLWIHPGCVKPGQIEVYRKGRFGGKLKKTVLEFNAENPEATIRLNHSLAFNGNRVVHLGNSVYDKEGPTISYEDEVPEIGHQPDHVEEAATPKPEPNREPEPEAPSTKPSTEPLDYLDIYQAVQGLDLCSQMLNSGSESIQSSSSAAKRGLTFKGFLDESILKCIEDGEDLGAVEDDKLLAKSQVINVISIDARATSSSMAGLAAIAAQFDDDEVGILQESSPKRRQLTAAGSEEVDMFGDT